MLYIHISLPVQIGWNIVGVFIGYISDFPALLQFSPCKHWFLDIPYVLRVPSFACYTPMENISLPHCSFNLDQCLSSQMSVTLQVGNGSM